MFDHYLIIPIWALNVCDGVITLAIRKVASLPEGASLSVSLPHTHLRMLARCAAAARVQCQTQGIRFASPMRSFSSFYTKEHEYAQVSEADEDAYGGVSPPPISLFCHGTG